MKRVFDDADRIKKIARVPVKSTPAEAPSGLTEAVKASLYDGYLPCATAFEIAKRLEVPLVAVGNAADDLGVRVVNCQLGCFKVKKAVLDTGKKSIIPDVAEAVDAEIAKGPLTCAGVFGLARRLKVPPIEIADAANETHTKIHHCQLSCF
ncbi:MAG: hypothetical protein V1823_02130 [Chloroflexota bacterium]